MKNSMKTLVVVAVTLTAFAALAQAQAQDQGVDWMVKIAEFIGTILMAGLALIGKKVHELIDTKINNQWVAGVLARTDDLILRTIRELYQKEIQALKESRQDGKLTPEEMQRFKQVAIDSVKFFLGAGGIKELADVLGAGGVVEKFLSTSIESAIAGEKSGNPS